MYIRELDLTAFEAVYRRYYKGLCAFAVRYTADYEESEDIVQTVMLWLWENRSTIHPDQSVQSLLFTIVKNRCLNCVAHGKIKARVHEDYYKNICENHYEPDDYTGKELMESMIKAIRNLPKDYRKAFVMNRFGDYTYAEIAAKLNVSPKTIAYRITQSLKLLREALKEYM
ncbi:MAG: RNA polymerase sigma-70 factor [Tannerella sp.]|jgi:RNA polymerase sigma-70 factor (ECF subfamily)|nr:RNA polymerase sigma-70 factor [Tannerella sp.]